MIKEYICEKIDAATIYCKVQIYYENDSNNWKFWWNIYSNIEYELIVSFQLQLKSLTWMWFHKKHMDKFFIQMNIISVLKKNILLKFYFHLKDDKNYVGGLYIKFHFICLSKC
jgi:hypothetical protein